MTAKGTKRSRWAAERRRRTLARTQTQLAAVLARVRRRFPQTPAVTLQLLAGTGQRHPPFAWTETDALGRVRGIISFYEDWLEQADDSALRAVMAHELGHLVLGHVAQDQQPGWRWFRGFSPYFPRVFATGFSLCLLAWPWLEPVALAGGAALVSALALHQYLLRLLHQREFEADDFSARFTCGEALLRALETWHAHPPGAWNRWRRVLFSSHPSNARRRCAVLSRMNADRKLRRNRLGLVDFLTRKESEWTVLETQGPFDFFRQSPIMNRIPFLAALMEKPSSPEPTPEQMVVWTWLELAMGTLPNSGCLTDEIKQKAHEKADYLLRMYWLGRTDKFRDDLLPGLAWATRAHVPADVLKTDPEPPYLNSRKSRVLFPDANHHALAHQVVDGLLSDYALAKGLIPAKRKGFFQRLRGA